MRSAGSDDRPAPLGVYVHFPFCSIRCTYCDFPTAAGRDDRIEAYLAALDLEIRGSRPHLPREADTVFLGGGTPSRLTPGQLGRVLGALRSRFDLAEGAEITLEGNPESLTLDRLRAYRDLGVTRISVGVQSLDDAVLKRVGRAHGAREAERAVRDARAAGFPDVSLDLIAGLPGEDPGRWPETVRRCASFGPDHVSVYLLETDKDTPLARAVRAGRSRVAGDDDQGALYEATVAALEREGLRLYEISNFARGAHRSRHNLKYWTDAPYAGFGNGAHEYVDGARRSNRRDLDGYVDDVTSGRDPVDERDPFDPERRLQEALFLGLRVAEGVDLDRLGRRYGIDPRARWREAWERAHDADLTVVEGSRVRLTAAGRLRSNELFAEFLT
jgi:oxygen-independent coproporphyrinogen-3 oxidase